MSLQLLRKAERISSLAIHRGKKLTECFIQPRQSLRVTWVTASIIRGVKRSVVSNGFLLIPDLTFDQNSSIGLRKGDYGGK